MSRPVDGVIYALFRPAEKDHTVIAFARAFSLSRGHLAPTTVVVNWKSGLSLER